MDEDTYGFEQDNYCQLKVACEVRYRNLLLIIFSGSVVCEGDVELNRRRAIDEDQKVW